MVNLQDLHLHWGQCKYKGKSYRSYSLARAYRKDGRNRKEIIYKLGKLTEDEVVKWRSLLKGLKKPEAIVTTLDDIKVTEHYAYLDVATANAIWDYWQLDEVFQNNGKRDVKISSIARILAVNRCIDPVSKSQTPEWVVKTALPWMFDIDRHSINATRIFRELAIIESHKEAICEHIFNLLSIRNPESMDSVFYDLSSTTFTGSRCVLMKWGHCKEGYRNHVVLAIVVNKDGLPFYWEVLPGGTADATTMVWLVDRLKKRFKTNNTTLVFDRGMVSDENLALLENEDPEIKYISAMDKSQINSITNVDFSNFSYFNSKNVEKQVCKLTNFRKLNDTTYYKEVKVEGMRRYILCFNPQLFKDQRKARNQAVENFKFFTNSLNAELLDAKKSRQRKATYKKFKHGITKFKLTSFVDVTLRVKHVIRKKADGTEQKVRTYHGTVEVNEKSKQTAGELDGFWLLVTNHTERERDSFSLSAQQAIAPYRDKVVIEAAFRDIKSFVQVAPVCVYTEAHVKAHYTICVLSHLMNRTLTLRLHENEGKKTKEIVSHEKLYKNLSGCMVDHIEVQNVGLSTYNLSRATSEQKELLARIGLTNLISGNIIKKIKSIA
jgi:transposase